MQLGIVNRLATRWTDDGDNKDGSRDHSWILASLLGGDSDKDGDCSWTYRRHHVAGDVQVGC